MSHFVTEKQFILLSGIPGSGKTTVGEYLNEKYGFYLYETDKRWDEFINELRRLGVEKFIEKLLDENGTRVCLEWGFDPLVFLDDIISFKDHGASIFWLTCDRRIALLNYLKKNISKDPACICWSSQVNKIDYVGLPTSDFTIIQTYHNGNSIPFEELTQKILSKSAYVPPK